MKDTGLSCSTEVGDRGKENKDGLGAGVDRGPSRPLLREMEEVAMVSVGTFSAFEGQALLPVEDKRSACLQKPFQAQPRATPG